MFGLTRREQLWAAEERLTKVLAPVLEQALRLAMDVRAAELDRVRKENDELRRQLSERST